MDKIAFFHMNQLGDLMFSLPLLSAARRAWLEQQLFSVVRPELAPLLKASGLVDGVILRSKRDLINKIRLVGLLREQRFSRAVLFSESPEVLLMSFLSGIPERHGFSTASLGFLLTEKAGRKGVPSLSNNRSLAQVAGLDNLPPDYVGLIKVPYEERAKMDEWISDECIVRERLIVVSPGASKRRREKCWPTVHWTQFLDTAVRNGGYPVLVGAPGERDDLERIAASALAGVKVFTAPDGILSLAALLSRARAFVGVDSGAMHLAASLDVPVVALFGPTDPAQVGPQPLEKHVVIKNRSMAEIEPDEVWKAVASIESL